MRAFALLLGLLPLLPAGVRSKGPAVTPVYGYSVVAKYPHLTTSYTEGFFFLNDSFYEGTGQVGRSQVLVIDPETGKPRQHVELGTPYFGEGIVDWGPNLLEWTWQTHTGFVRSQFTLQPIREFHYTGEGWGMTRTARELITSDGTATLRFRNPETFAETRHVEVKDLGEPSAKPVGQLNELEFIHGEIWANVWHSDRIARISPRDGRVIAWVDLTDILPAAQRADPEAVLNGIAYDAKRDRIFVTGKLWPYVFQIKVDAKPHSGAAH